MAGDDKQPIENKDGEQNNGARQNQPGSTDAVAKELKPWQITAKKVLKIALDVLFVLVIAFALFVLGVTVAAKKTSEGTATVFGYQLRFVMSGSMEKSDQTDVSKFKIKSIPVKSCVFIKTAPTPDDQTALNAWCAKLAVGDVLTFQWDQLSGPDKVVTHRIVSIKEKEGGGYIITLEGDNKAEGGTVGQQVIDTTKDGFNYIIGKVEGQSYLLGLLVYAMKSPWGLVFIIIIPCLIVIAFETIKIISVINADKNAKKEAEKTEKDDEIARLRQQLEQMQQAQNNQPAAQTEPQNSDNRNDEQKTPDDGDKA